MKRFTLMLIASAFMCNAQEYKAAALFEAEGNIKSIEYNSRDISRTLEHTAFTQDGKFEKNNIYTYDNNGYPIEYTANWKKKNGKDVFDAKTTVKYNEQNKPVYIDEYGKLFKRMKLHTTTSLSYNDDGNVAAKCGQNIVKSDTIDFEYKYDHYTFDEKGNWATRAVTFKTKSNKKGLKTGTYIESREIEYYD